MLSYGVVPVGLHIQYEKVLRSCVLTRLVISLMQSARKSRSRKIVMQEKTLFTKIIEREVPANIVYEDEQCIAFYDIHPVAPIHVLLVPKQPIPSIAAASIDDQAVLGYLFAQVSPLVKRLGCEDAFRVVINNGAGAGQTVFHLHLHIIAGRALQWPPG